MKSWFHFATILCLLLLSVGISSKSPSKRAPKDLNNIYTEPFRRLSNLWSQSIQHAWTDFEESMRHVLIKKNADSTGGYPLDNDITYYDLSHDGSYSPHDRLHDTLRHDDRLHDTLLHDTLRHDDGSLQDDESSLHSNISPHHHTLIKSNTLSSTRVSNPCSRLIVNGTIIPNGVSRHVKYTQSLYYCNGTQVSREVYLQERQLGGCNETTTTTTTCFCSQDRYNSKCSATRKLSCQINRVFPTDNCLIPDDVSQFTLGGVSLDGFFNCLRFDTTQEPTFIFQMNCSFQSQNDFSANSLPRDVLYIDLSNGKNYTWTEIMSNFTYFTHDSQQNTDGTFRFALSQAIPDPIEFKPINFFNISDSRAVLQQLLTEPEHYIGEKNFTFSLKFSSLPDEFYAGNRLYIETGYRKSSYFLKNQTYQQTYVDFENLSEPKYVNYMTIILATTLPVGSLFLLCIGGIVLTCVLYRRYKRRKFLRTIE